MEKTYINTLEELFPKLYKIYTYIENKNNEKRKKGEFFNVFNTVNLRTEEVRLHSAFIAEFLNPQGNHGMGDKAVKIFMKTFGVREDFINVNKINEKIKERFIGNISDDSEHGGRIDIILEDGNNAIIIENKIYASDQTNQLLRYYNYAKEQKFKEFKLIYLTLEGHEPSEKSTKKEVENYICASYKYNIIRWLTECINEAPCFVKSTISQYINLIKQITGMPMEKDKLNEIANLVLKGNNIEAVSLIIQANDEICKKLREEYIFKEIKKYAEEHEYVFEKSKDGDPYPALKLTIQSWKDDIKIYVEADDANLWRNMFIGIKYEQECDVLPSKLLCLSDKPNKDEKKWCHGWEYLPDNLRNWHSNENYLSMKNGEVANYIKEKIKEIIEEVDNNEKLSKVIKIAMFNILPLVSN